MDWDLLLSDQRLGKAERELPSTGRSSFHRDYDRVVFSSAFRRLQDKTQVFPLAKSDYVRTRLTHSLEASCVGRSLGMEVGIRLDSAKRLPRHIDVAGIGMIVSTACLAHDIGNPPFGHAGEQAIQEWFKGDGKPFVEMLDLKPQQLDFLRFEGNAQGFRILTRLQHPEDAGGLQLTYATLAGFTKYPTSSEKAHDKGATLAVSEKKHGFFHADSELFRQVAEGTGLLPKEQGHGWCRHPLAFLVEAADDICYSIIDLEDGFHRRHIGLREAIDLLECVIDDSSVLRRLDSIRAPEEQLSFLRAKAIYSLVLEVADEFMKREEDILSGMYNEELLKSIPRKKADAVSEVKRIDKGKVYDAREVIEIEVPGFNVLSGLLDAFVLACEDVSRKGREASPKSRMLIKLIPDQFLDADRIPHGDPYQRLLSVTDFICGMTDRYSVNLYKQISGMSL